MIPTTHFFHFFSRKTYALILDGSLWTLDYADKGDFRIDIDGATYSVQEGPSLLELESDYFEDMKESLDAFIEKTIKEHERYDVMTVQEMRLAELARFVIEKIIPSHNPHAIDRQGCAAQERLAVGTTIDIPSKVRRRRRQNPACLQEDNILPSILWHRYLFADSGFFELCRAASSRQRIIHFRGDDLCLGNSAGSLHGLEQRYRREIESRLVAKAIDGDSSVASRFRKASHDGRLVESVRLGHLHDAASGVGFTIHGGDFYVTQSIPTYTLESRRFGAARFYEFPEAVIGIKLHKDEEEHIDWSEPIVMNRYKHPCLPGDGAMQKMCLGSFCFHTLRKRGTVERQVLRLLYESRKMLTSGYFGVGMPFHHLDDRRYLEYQQDLSRVRAPITNAVVA